MKTALVYASVASMIEQFNLSNITLLLEMGYKVDVACNFEKGSTVSQEVIDKMKINLKKMNVNCFHIPVPRNATDFKNIYISYKKTKNLINERKYDLIHCHSPIGGLVCRIANKNSQVFKTSIMIYTAHGFHFFKGNNIFKNLLFKNIEKFGAKYTDILITINEEDFEAAKKFKLKNNGSVEYIPGVGIDSKYIESIKENRYNLIKDLDIPEKSILLLSVGELNENKNHKAVIKSLAMLPANVHYLICGVGELEDKLLAVSNRYEVNERLHLLGFKNNVIEIMKSCDIFVFPSKREGLSVALMEALTAGMVCIASNIRGNKDLISEEENGFLFDLNSEKELLKALKEGIELCQKKELVVSRKIQVIDKENIKNKIKKLYSRVEKRGKYD